MTTKMIYDLRGFPTGLNFDVWFKIYKEENVVFWQSANYGAQPIIEPKLIDAPDDVRLVDISKLTKDEQDEILNSIT